MLFSKACEVLFQLIDCAVCIIDQNFNILRVNPMFLAMYGISEKEALGKKCFEITHNQSCPCDLSTLQCPVREVLDTEKMFQGEHVHSGSDGLMHYVKSQAFPFKDTATNSSCVVVITHDITDQKIARKKLEELTAELAKAKTGLQSLTGLLPICAACKKIRDDRGHWESIETYISEHSKATFTHGLCPECTSEYFPSQKKG